MSNSVKYRLVSNPNEGDSTRAKLVIVDRIVVKGNERNTD